MATEAQIAANRQNSQKSTGPKSAEGKAVVAQNALKHGLFSTLVVVNGESQEDFDLFRDEMVAELVPVGIIESVLAERIVSLAWRLKRAEVMQRQVIDELIDRNAKSLTSAWGYSESDPLQSPDYLPLGRIATTDWANSRVIERLLMYERRIEHSLFKIMAELKRLQRLREKEQAPAPCPPEEERPNCEKQSQFPGDRIGVKSFSPKDYENRPDGEHRGNKPNSEPVGANFGVPQHCRDSREKKKAETRPVFS